MKILVANLGSTSFKYRLFDMTREIQLAHGGVQRIGARESECVIESRGKRHHLILPIPDHAAALSQCLQSLTDQEMGCLDDPAEVAAIGFKAVHGGDIDGIHLVTPAVLDAMQQVSQVAPAHNPPYIEAMRLLAERMPEIPLVAAFEAGFHRTIPAAHRHYAVPYEWAEQHGVLRWGFHGASHCFIAQRASELADRNDLRIISCHLGGSSSLCAIRDRQSVATTMGMSPQTGLPQNNRCGDFDPFAIPTVMRATGMSLEQVLDELAARSGLLGLSGLSGDVRDLQQAAEQGDQRAELALGVYVAEIRRHLGGMMVALGGVDVVAFTGGIGENSPSIRRAVCEGLQELGIALDPVQNRVTQREIEIGQADHRVRIWVIPTNEELVVARQVKQLLEG